MMTNSVKRFYCLCCVVYLGTLSSLVVAEVAEVAESSSGSRNVVIRNIECRASQGVAVDGEYFYAISNTEISKCDKGTGGVIATWQADRRNEAYKHFKHLNSGTVVEGRLYCAHSRYAVDPNDNTIEIWNVEKEGLEHEKTIHMPGNHGSLTWIDRRLDGSWWMCYAVYGSVKNVDTKLVKYEYEGNRFLEVRSWAFPQEVTRHWGNMSCSGGSWGPDGYLYTTGHDHARAYVLEVDETNTLKYVRTERDVGFFGQAIAWDRFSKRPILWGIVKNKTVSLTLIPEK